MSTTAGSSLGSFSFHDRAPVRVFGTPEEPLFVAQEICAALGVGKHRDALQRVPEWAQGRPLRVDAPGGRGLGGSQTLATLTEAGVYYLVLRSDKPEAEAFQQWVCCEVLPAVRKQGFYTATGGLPEAARRLRELELEIEAQRYLLAADEARRRLLVLRGGLPPPAPEDVQTVGEWLAVSGRTMERQERLAFATTVKFYARRQGLPEYRRFPKNNPRYSSPAWRPEVIAEAFEQSRHGAPAAKGAR